MELEKVMKKVKAQGRKAEYTGDRYVRKIIYQNPETNTVVGSFETISERFGSLTWDMIYVVGNEDGYQVKDMYGPHSRDEIVLEPYENSTQVVIPVENVKVGCGGRGTKRNDIVFKKDSLREYEN